jgi:hypothetical protein
VDDDDDWYVEVYGNRPVDPIVVEDLYVSTGLVDQHWREIVRRKEPMGFIHFNKDKYNVLPG